MSTGPIKPHWKPFITTTIIDAPPTTDKKKPSPSKKPWLPLTLRKPYLLALILTTIALIIIVQWLLYVSRRDQGIIFAEDVNELPLRRSFCYLYLPTIVSVVYGFLWTWVDLDVKRLEPWFQVSREGGATAGGSVLLGYPLEFLVTIPFSAFKRKHWTVFAASLASLLILGGLTPSQAGIFATRTVEVFEEVSGLRSTRFTPLEQQGNLSAIYAQSVYNIAWLNESLPSFMTKEYVLSAFGPSVTAPTYAKNVSYSGQSTMYSVDISCENVTMWPRAAGAYYNTSSGCSFYGPAYRTQGGNDTSKPFDTMYVGYQNQGGFADYYLSSYCDEKFFHNFFIRWSKANPDFITNNTTDSLAPGQANETSLFCVPTYFQQQVNATIALPSQEVLLVGAIGEKQSLPNDLFNSSTFEWAMSSGQAQFSPRSNYPVAGFPEQKSQLVDHPLNLAYIPKMAPFAIATHQLPMEEYLDANALRTSYESAYRLLFSRLLSDNLNSTLDSNSPVAGGYSYITQAVVVVPVFAWITTAMLVSILLLAMFLCLMCPIRPNHLRDDPGTVGALLDMVAGDENTSEIFSSLNHCRPKQLDQRLKDKTFILSTNGESSQLREVGNELQDRASSNPDDQADAHLEGVRPGEMKTDAGAGFLLVQLLAVAAFATLLCKARSDSGLPLPSNSSFVRQLVEKYIPIALATCIEPFWLVLNRLLCLLQPFEELRKGGRPASKSIELNYSSLPPQLVLTRALRAGHLILTAVCLMTLLANVLAVALGGLMYEDAVTTSRIKAVSRIKDAKFSPLNGTGLPFNTDQKVNSQGGTTFEPFYRQMSNNTAGTLLPPWTDEKYSYVPVDLTETGPNDTIWLETTAFGANANCRLLETTGADNYTMRFGVDASSMFIDVRFQADNESPINCSNFAPWGRTYDTSGQNFLRYSRPGHLGLELNALLSNANKSSNEDLFCRQHVLLGWLRTDWEIRTGKDGGMSVDQLPKMKLDSHKATMLLCKPSISVQTADIKVDSSGQVHRLRTTTPASGPPEEYFASTEQDLVAQANQFFIDSDSSWHNDSYPSDFINYLIIGGTNDTSLIDISLTVPDPEIAARYIADLYKRLFALLVSTYSNALLEDNTDNATVEIIVETPETRILVSTSAFIVAETILACYVLVTILFYARRPWRVLPRLPSSIASIVSYFAASEALHELALLRRREPRVDLREVMAGWRWSYGTFEGKDGRTHLGVDRAELASAVEKTALRERRKGQA